MSTCRSATGKRGNRVLCISGILVFLASGLQSPLFAKDEINVTRDKEKTVYTIESPSPRKDSRDERTDTDRAWEMLNKMPIIMDNRQTQPVQPAPAK